jgi:hypothetical protein
MEAEKDESRDDASLDKELLGSEEEKAESKKGGAAMTEEEKEYVLQQTIDELRRQAHSERLYNELKTTYDREGMSLLQS